MIKQLLGLSVIGLFGLFLLTGCGNSGANLSNPLLGLDAPTGDDPGSPTPTGNKVSGSDSKATSKCKGERGAKKKSKKSEKSGKSKTLSSEKCGHGDDDDDDDDRDDDHDD